MTHTADPKMIDKRLLWFEKTEPGSTEALLSDSSTEDAKADLSFAFDYEKPRRATYLLHMDTGITARGIAHILIRTSLEIPYAGSIGEIFSPGILNGTIREVFESTVYIFKQTCKQKGISFTGEIPFTDDLINEFANTMNEQYLIRRKDDAANRKMREQDFLSFTSGEETLMLVNGTLMIIDEVLVLNRLFDRKHNQSVFFIPLPVYHTLKLKCMKLEKETIVLNLLDSTFFLICLDCALQLLVSDHADALQPALSENGFTPEVKQEYLQYGSNYFKNVWEHLLKCGAKITNLEIFSDWNTLIRQI